MAAVPWRWPWYRRHGRRNRGAVHVMASYPGYMGPMGSRSPIFGTPQAPQGLLGLDRRKKQQLQAVADTLTQLGIGLMGQGPSTTPQSPLQGLAAGLQGASQMQAVRQGQAQ